MSIVTTKKISETFFNIVPLSSIEFCRNRYCKALYELYQNDSLFKDIREGSSEADSEPISWDLIQKGLYDESKKIMVVVINSRNGQMNNNDPSGKKKRFDYDDHKEEGACVIAIGGKVLSRGLTLEGIMTCYYSRNAGAYDTFFQMCRWFGYRPKYMDLCRICRLAGDPETKRSRKTCSGT